MICEPNLDLPQKIDLETLKKSDKPETTVEEDSKIQDDDKVVHKVTYELKEYNLLPVFSDEFDHLNDILSINSNDYLAKRWNKFLDNVPDNYVRIRLYMDYKKSLEKHVVRPMLLNGQFYGIDNKLAPIPQLSDPRNLGNKNK
ncbi:hypothetical protein DOY81_006203 [Sarcophaga bullata]|nr:hypothetical protein DOY81_006203 [Sarcophaga bullata]